MVLEVDPTTPYSILKKAIGRFVYANIQSVSFVGSGVTVRLPPRYHAETVVGYPLEQNLDIEIQSDGQVIADGLAFGDVEQSDQLRDYLLKQGQVLMSDPNRLTFVVLSPVDSAPLKYTLSVLNAISSVNKKLDSFQSDQPKENRILLDLVYIGNSPLLQMADEQEKEVKDKDLLIDNELP